MISLGQQNGGPDIAEEFNASAQALRNLLGGLKQREYVQGISELAVILRINGRLANYGAEGIERPRKFKTYIQVDVVVPEERWKSPVEASRAYLFDCLVGSIHKIIEYAHSRKLAIDENALEADIREIGRRFLNFSPTSSMEPSTS